MARRTLGWRVPDGTPKDVTALADEALDTIVECMRIPTGDDLNLTPVPGANPEDAKLQADIALKVHRERIRIAIATARVRLDAARAVREEICGKLSQAPELPQPPPTIVLPLPRTPAHAVSPSLTPQATFEHLADLPPDADDDPDD